MSITLAAMVSVILSNGTTCGGKNYATSSATTPNFNVSVCVTSDVPWCGMTYYFERVGTGGTLRINKRTDFFPVDYADEGALFPQTITTLKKDLGFVWVDPKGFAPVTKLKVATYNITVLGSKVGTTYKFKLGDQSMVATDPIGSCGTLFGGTGPYRYDPVSMPEDSFINGEFSLIKR